MDRRRFLAASAALAACVAGASPLARALPDLLPRARSRRVVIVGGGWGGLSAARHLRALAPDLEVVLVERNASFFSGPLSNKWLAGLVDGKLLVHDYAAAAKAYGYTWVRAQAEAVDRDARQVITDRGSVPYDWLVLAVGIRYDYSAWYGEDARAAAYTRATYPCAYIPGAETVSLKAKLDAFGGGDLLITLPPAPYRCPPSPYERACMIGWLLKSRRIKGRLIVLDPNPMAHGFARTFSDQYKDQITYVPQSALKAVDPFNRRISTEFDEYRFDDAILMPPQQAGDLVWQAGLVERSGDGKPTGWADQDPVTFQSRQDERIFLIGDVMGNVSPLFAHYPKSGHMANRQGRIVARQIAARATGALPEPLLPDGQCYVFTSVDPAEAVRIDSQYRLRGDGLIVQTTRQSYDPNPSGEDVAWAKSLYAEFLAYAE